MCQGDTYLVDHSSLNHWYSIKEPSKQPIYLGQPPDHSPPESKKKKNSKEEILRRNAEWGVPPSDWGIPPSRDDQ